MQFPNDMLVICNFAFKYQLTLASNSDGEKQLKQTRHHSFVIISIKMSMRAITIKVTQHLHMQYER